MTLPRSESRALNAGRAGAQPEVRDGHAPHQRVVEVREARGERREICPRDLTVVGEMPDAPLAVDEQIEHSINQVWHIGRRDDDVVRGEQFAAGRDLAERVSEEAVVVDGTKECRRADNQGLAGERRDPLFGGTFARAVDVDRACRVTLDIGPRS